MARAKKEVVVDKTLKFVWAYLILKGKQTSGKWSYYGSGWDEPEIDGRRVCIGWNEQQKQAKELREKVVSIGIDWSKTTVPEISHESGFQGTFSDTVDHITATLGKLVLKNGETFMLGSTEDEAHVLTETARQMLKTPGESEVEIFAKSL